MNPDLVKAARAVLAAQAQYPDLTNDQADKIVRFHTANKFGAGDAEKLITSLRADGGNAVASGLQGFTGNFGDEIVGALPKFLGGGEAEKEKMRLRAELIKQDHPVGDAAAGIAGGIGSALVGGAALKGGAALAGRFLPKIPEALQALSDFKIGGRVATAAAKAAAAGAAYGGVAGVGAGENAADRLHGGAAGAGTGAVIGGVLGAAGSRIAGAFGKNRIPMRIANAVEQSSAPGMPKTLPNGLDALNKSLGQFNTAGLGKEVMFADLSPHTQMANRFALNNDTNTYVDVADKLNQRQAGMSERLLTGARKASGGKMDAGAIQRDLEASRKAWASPAYDNLRKSGVEFTQADLGPHTQSPQFKAAMNDARTAEDLLDPSKRTSLLDRLSTGDRSPESMKALTDAMNNNADPLSKNFQLPSGSTKPNRPISFTDLQALKRGLDGKVGMAYHSGNVPLAQSYSTIRDGIRSAIVAKMPEYGAVDAEYAGRKKLEDMLAKGVDAWHHDDPSLAGEFAAMPAASQEFLQKGLAAQLQGDLRKAATNQNAAGRIVNGSKSMQEKLGIIFGDKGNLENFMNAAGKEKVMNRTLNAVGGSQTYLLGKDAGFSPLAQVPTAMHMGPAYAAAKVLAKAFIGDQIQKSAVKTAEFTMKQGTPAVRAALEELARRSQAPLLSTRAAGLLGVGATAAGRGLAGLFQQQP